MRRGLFLSSLCLLVAALPVAAQAPQNEVAGTWALVPSVERGRRAIRAGFERALRDLNPLLRAVARQQIDADAMLARRIEVAIEGSRVVTTMHTTARHRFATRLRYPARVTDETGTSARLTQLLRDGSLELVFEAERGRRWTVLTPVGADRLEVTTTIDPEPVDEHVRFRHAYRRVR